MLSLVSGLRIATASQTYIPRLGSLSWTQEEIGGVLGVVHARVSGFLSEFPELEKQVKNSLKLGHEEVPSVDVYPRNDNSSPSSSGTSLDMYPFSGLRI